MRPSFAACAVAAAVAGLLASAPPARAAEGWTWPVRGRVVTAYLNDNARPYAGGMHRGIDVAAEPGAAVVAARAGTVTYAGALGSAGIVVAVRSDDGRHVTTYLHLRAESVARGEHLAPGARLGEVGTTGRRSSAEPHLHLGVRLADVEDRYVDPLALLPPLPGARARSAPVPLPARAPARAQEAPVRVPVAARAGATVRAAVPAGPLPAPRARRVRHPAARGALVERAAPAPDRGRPLVLAGLGLLALLAFGGALVRLNGAVNERAAALAAALRRALGGLGAGPPVDGSGPVRARDG